MARLRFLLCPNASRNSCVVETLKPRFFAVRIIWQAKAAMPASNATSRFSDRVDNYIRYRPGYPPQVLETLKSECGLKPEHRIADIASGTGIWTRLLLENGNNVVGVEPNAEMRQAAERLLASFPNFTSVAATAESTTLPDHSLDFVTAAQAAHWFNREQSRQEFMRILKPGGWLVLVWNERLTDSTPFLRDYEQLLLTYGTDYQDIRHERTTDAVNEFFDPEAFGNSRWRSWQVCDVGGQGVALGTRQVEPRSSVGAVTRD